MGREAEQAGKGESSQLPGSEVRQEGAEAAGETQRCCSGPGIASRKLGSGLRSPGWTSICQGEAWDLLSRSQREKDATAVVELGQERRDVERHMIAGT